MFMVTYVKHSDLLAISCPDPGLLSYNQLINATCDPATPDAEEHRQAPYRAMFHTVYRGLLEMVGYDAGPDRYVQGCPLPVNVPERRGNRKEWYHRM